VGKAVTARQADKQEVGKKLEKVNAQDLLLELAKFLITADIKSLVDILEDYVGRQQSCRREFHF